MQNRVQTTGCGTRDNGIIGGVSQVMTTMLLIPAGYYVDKVHPIRLGMMAMIWSLVFVPTTAVVYLWDMPHSTVFWFSIIRGMVTLPFYVIFMASELPMFMRLLPHSRFGQFCSAMAVIRAGMMIVASIACGLFLDGLKLICQTRLHIPGDYYYRLIFIWQIVFMSAAIYFRVKLYKLWLKLGGDDNYVPPMFEEDEAELKDFRAGISESELSDTISK